MLGFDPRAARVAWTVALVAAGIVGLYLLRRTIFVFALGIFVAYMMSPLVGLIGRVVHTRFGRAYTVVISFALVILVVAVAAAALGPAVGSQLTQLADQLPDLARKVQDGRLPLPAALQPWQEEIGNAVRDAVDQIASRGFPFAQGLARDIATLLENLVLVVLVPILAFLLLKDGPKLRERLLFRMTPPEERGEVDDLLEDLHQTLGQYVRSIGTLALVTFVTYAVFFSAMGVPFAFALAAIGGTLEIIPVIGPIAAGTIALSVAAVSGYEQLVALLGFFLAYQFVENWLLSPRIMGSGLQLHPVLVIFAFLAGEELAGVPGMFLSVPVLAIASVVVARMRGSRRPTAG